MKRLIFIAFMVAAGAFIISCNTDDKKTKIQFTNAQTQAFTEVRWGDGTSTELTFTQALAQGSATALQETKLSQGEGEGFDGTTTYQLKYTDSNSQPANVLVLKDKDDNNYVITSFKKK